MEELRLERVEERFHVRVLAGPVERRALLDAEATQAIAKERSGVLAAAITVEDERGPGAPTSHGGIQNCAGQMRAAPSGERPGEDAPRVLIHHDGEEAPPTRDGDVRDVPDPDAIRPPHRQAPNPVGVLAEELVQLRVAAIDARCPGSEPRDVHQAHHAAPTDRDPLGVERADDPWAAVHSAVGAKDFLEPLQQGPVLLRVRTRPASCPRVIAGASDAVECAESGQGERRALRVDERERFTLGSEQNRIAFFRRACSV
jgi:hypothetical protein